MDDTERKSRPDDPVSAKHPIGATKTVATQDGRHLTYLEVGDPDGPLVIHNHGGPSSRLEARLFADSASKNRLRFICVDRPGIGQSSPQKARTYAGWADDMTTIADALGYREFGVTGWSEGGPWALAAAAYIDPVRLRHVSSIAGGSYGTFGDNWAAKYLSKADALGGFLALHFEPGFRLMYAALGITAEHFRGSFAKQVRKAVNDYDRQVLLQPDFETAFYDSCAECFAQGSDGLVRDAELLYRSWAFDVTRTNGESTCGKDWMTSLYRLPSTSKWLTECLERYGIQLREPVISWLSVQRTKCSQSRPRNWVDEPEIEYVGRNDRC